MLTDPRFDLQRTIVQTLKSDAAVAAIVSDRIYDRVPRGKDGAITADYPFIGLGETQMLPHDSECTDAADTSITLHGWSQSVGFPETLRLSAAIAAALHDVQLPLASGTLQSLLLESSRILRDPDGLTSHAVLTFSALTDAN